MKSSRILFLTLVSSIIILTAGVWLVWLFAPHVWTTLAEIFHAISYACQTAWADVTQRQIIAAIVLAVIALGILVQFVRLIRRGIFARRFNARSTGVLPVSLLSIAADAKIDVGRLNVCKDDKVFALTAGVRIPEVFISQGALRTLTRTELQAVLEHEAHHLQTREPLRRLLIFIVTCWIPFSILRRRLVSSYVTASEVEADAQVTNQAALGAAILRITPTPQTSSSLVANFSPLDARIERLLNATYHQSSRILVGYFLGVLMFVGMLFILTPNALASWFGSHQIEKTQQHLNVCKVEHERAMQSQNPLQTCGSISSPQTCAFKLQ
jgi:beta-lactamase regulating signal transducer with metallopeptidase domain